LARIQLPTFLHELCADSFRCLVEHLRNVRRFVRSSSDFDQTANVFPA
jgi:hypothetical protein